MCFTELRIRTEATVDQVSVLHEVTVPSALPQTRRFPSALNLTAVIALLSDTLCSKTGCWDFQLTHRRRPFRVPIATISLLGLAATLSTSASHVIVWQGSLCSCPTSSLSNPKTPKTISTHHHSRIVKLLSPCDRSKL